ncbi:MAG: riboflavin synthase [Desulfovibrio sp.]|uniref:riboflavin synthase n=1 Tax=Desulfovibrio sp. 7SRBS1 TaxID=3378064 RepID=UPI003B3DDF2E
MFTGIILGQGRIEAVESRGNESRFRISPLFKLTDYVIGESIAVNGACLTVETVMGKSYAAYASGETLSRTNLGTLRPGSLVNLERALAFGDRLGGHLVSGHIDCQAEVESVTPNGQARAYRIRFPREQAPYVIPKGSVTLDGISLTVNDCGKDFLRVDIIPETQRVTTIAQWKPGYKMNMETDLIGKYVQNMLSPWAGEKDTGKTQAAAGGLTIDFLRENGF